MLIHNSSLIKKQICIPKQNYQSKANSVTTLIESYTPKTEQRKATENYRPVRQGNDGPAQGEPNNSIAEEASTSADQQNHPRRKPIADQPRQEADVLADVIGDAEQSQLALVET